MLSRAWAILTLFGICKSALDMMFVSNATGVMLARAALFHRSRKLVGQRVLPDEVRQVLKAGLVILP